MSPGWQSRARQRASRVVKRMARAFPVLSIERLAGVMPTFAASSPDDILRRASIMSMFTIIAMAVSLDSESVFFADSDRKAVDEGECQEYQRQEQVGIVDSEQLFGMEHDADIGVTDVVDEIDG